MKTYDWKTPYRLKENNAGYPTDEALRLVENIFNEMKSVDKDNMEFECKLTCFQKDALKAVFDFVCHIY